MQTKYKNIYKQNMYKHAQHAHIYKYVYLEYFFNKTNFNLTFQSYVSQISRILKTKIEEYKNYINKNITTLGNYST